MSDTSSKLTLDTLNMLQAQVNSVESQNQQLLSVVQSVAQELGAKQGMKLELLPALLREKLAKTGE